MTESQYRAFKALVFLAMAIAALFLGRALLGEVRAARQMALTAIDDLGIRAETQIAAARTETLQTVHDEAEATRTAAVGVLNPAITKADDRIGQMEADAVAEMDLLRIETLAQVRATRDDFKPGIDSLNELLADRALHAIPAQVLGLAAASKVTMGETAQTMQIVRDEAKPIATSIKGMADSGRAIAADVRIVADDYVKPRPWYRKVSQFAGYMLHAASLFK